MAVVTIVDFKLAILDYKIKPGLVHNLKLEGLAFLELNKKLGKKNK